MKTPALLRGLRVPAEIWAHPESVSKGVQGKPTKLFDVNVAPIDSVDPEVVERMMLETPYQKRQTFAHTKYPIETGMYLLCEGKEYPIYGVSRWKDEDGSGDVFYQLILEDIVSR